ncbi:MAG: hypothetical protein M3331_04910 [Actinomycetota bacterium]|nr:hypothetical protein [Actinomycetota bacterium]
MSRPTPMRPLTRTRLSLLLIFLTVLLAGCGEEEDVSPSFEDRIPLGLELDAADRVVKWKKGTTLTGVLTQGAEKLSGETVVLEFDSYPYGGDFAELESAQTDKQGRFEFEVTPDANTAYRAAAGELSEATSPEALIYVEPLTEIEKAPSGNGTRFTSVFRHPKDRSIQGSNVFSYVATAADAEATGKLGFIRVDRVTQKRTGLSTASIVLPFSSGEVRYSACYGYTPDSGLGLPNARCSQTEVPAGG